MKTIKIITLLISVFVLSVVMVLPTGAFAAKSKLNKQINSQIKRKSATKAKSFSTRPWDWDNKKPKRQITSKKPQHPKPWVHNASTANNLQQLNKMRAVMALHQRSNGSFCQIDVRGGSKKNTPSFVKSAHRSTTLPKSKFDTCSAQERKAFQKKAKNSYLKGGKAQKTSVGAVAGMLAKSAGVGCVFGAGIAWVADMFSGGGDDASNAKTAKAAKTEAGANCVDCANKDLGLVNKGLASLSSIIANLKRDGKKIIITNAHLLSKQDFEKAQKDLKYVDTEIAKFEEIHLKNKTEHVKLVGFLREQGSKRNLYYESMASFKYDIDLKYKIRPESFLSDSEKQVINKAIDDVVNNRKAQFSIDEKLSSLKQDKNRLKNKISFHNESVKEKPAIIKRFLGGVASGVAGAIVCEDGTTYLLSDNPKTDI